MYYIEDYRKKKEEEKINNITTSIIDTIQNNIKKDRLYIFDYVLTGYNDNIDKIIKQLNYKAKQADLELEIKSTYIPSSSTYLEISATKRSIFLKFMMIEQDLYNRIVYDNITSFDINDNKLNRLYVLDALQTAFYQAGYEYSEISINGNKHLLPACNKAKKYFSKVIPIEMLHYYNNIEEERNNNLKKKIR